MPLGRAGAIYDLIVTVGFATPWTAAVVLELQRAAHAALGLPGSPTPVFGPLELMFTAMMGTAVTMWALARILHPVASLIAIDTGGRVAFSAWMVTALVGGASPVIVMFLAFEVLWGVLQGIGVFRALR
ncbi:hypothetical protein GJR97_17510 [Agromyces sp. Q22]|uniref:DUF4345 domain-containing protein n=1 Tax=Agromyces kandeliae TaxID=2666141 RepID=A0A6L5R6G5_9MICO|nr:hypothetical protein [Agromyces kandeliae]